jgi:hypothetical protein
MEGDEIDQPSPSTIARRTSRRHNTGADEPLLTFFRVFSVPDDTPPIAAGASSTAILAVEGDTILIAARHRSANENVTPPAASSPYPPPPPDGAGQDAHFLHEAARHRPLPPPHNRGLRRRHLRLRRPLPPIPRSPPSTRAHSRSRHLPHAVGGHVKCPPPLKNKLTAQPSLRTSSTFAALRPSPPYFRTRRGSTSASKLKPRDIALTRQFVATSSSSRAYFLFFYNGAVHLYQLSYKKRGKKVIGFHPPPSQPQPSFNQTLATGGVWFEFDAQRSLLYAISPRTRVAKCAVNLLFRRTMVARCLTNML